MRSLNFYFSVIALTACLSTTLSFVRIGQEQGGRLSDSSSIIRPVQPQGQLGRILHGSGSQQLPTAGTVAVKAMKGRGDEDEAKRNSTSRGRKKTSSSSSAAEGDAKAITATKKASSAKKKTGGTVDDEEGEEAMLTNPMPAIGTVPKSNLAKSSSSSSSKRSTSVKRKEEGPPFFDEALVSGEEAGDIYQGDKTFNLLRESEDVVAPWSVDGFEIDLPDWRPQAAEKYEIVDKSVLDKLDKIENMFGASLKLVSTYDGIWRFIYLGNIRNLIGAEAWTKILLTDDLKINGIKEVRFETMYNRDYPDDWN